MAATQKAFLFDPPMRRPLRIYASDPMAMRVRGNRAQVNVPTEPLKPGPCGERIEVLDYDGNTGRFYPPVDLDDPNVLMQGGLQPSESDPRFHQQMVYAVVARTLEHFDIALGRSISLWRSKARPRLRLFPHAFYGANAYYDSAMNAILFGYFRASEVDPGPNLPGQIVFTCLSHDIIVHEMTHAIVDRLRRHFMEPTNPDVLAFHEGFADIVALLQHFQYTDIVRDLIHDHGYDLGKDALLSGLAQQFGHATGSGMALRSAIGNPDAKLGTASEQPHERGSILVAAVFDAFLVMYQKRVQYLLRITGREQKSGQPVPLELAGRFAQEAWKVARALLRMCLRAFDYLPPLDVTFGDYLRALITADTELFAEDELGLRGAVIDAFSRRGVYPRNVRSLAEESLLWNLAPGNGPQAASPPAAPDPCVPERLDIDPALLLAVLRHAASQISSAPDACRPSAAEGEGARMQREGRKARAKIARFLHAYAKRNAYALSLDSDRKIHVHGFHPVFRISNRGRLLIELVVQFVQTDYSTVERYGGIPLRGGCTLIARTGGAVRYVITKPLPSRTILEAEYERGLERERRFSAFVENCDRTDPGMTYYGDADYRQRMRLRMDLRSLHSGPHP